MTSAVKSGLKNGADIRSLIKIQITEMISLSGKRLLAFDFGASSGRAILGTYSDGRLQLEEIHRFSNDPVNLRGTLYWDVLRLFFEIKQGITKAVHAGGFDAIGIDTWGVDFGLLDAEGRLLRNPVHYRDSRTDGMQEEVFRTIPREQLYDRTGIQLMNLNTLFQLVAMTKYDGDTLSRAKTLLFIPDLFAYFLTGAKRAEFTVASTSQLLDPKTGGWAKELLAGLNIPTDILPEMIEPGQTYGMLSPEICEELGCPAVPVIAVGTHDTASAVVAVPTQEEDFIYISCGAIAAAALVFSVQTLAAGKDATYLAETHAIDVGLLIGEFLMMALILYFGLKFKKYYVALLSVADCPDRMGGALRRADGGNRSHSDG